MKHWVGSKGKSVHREEHHASQFLKLGMLKHSIKIKQSSWCKHIEHTLPVCIQFDERDITLQILSNVFCIFEFWRPPRSHDSVKFWETLIEMSSYLAFLIVMFLLVMSLRNIGAFFSVLSLRNLETLFFWLSHHKLDGEFQKDISAQDY